jgi:recombination protein RecT
MSEMVPIKQKVNTVAQTLNAPNFLQQLKAALPRTGLTAERMARIVLTEVRRVPKLADCRIESLMGAVMMCAQYGLEPGPAGHAWIIPRKNKGVLEANFQLGYKGLCQLLWRSGNVAWINCQVVHQKDRFDYSLGAPPRVDFRPSEEDDPGPVTHVFAALGTTGGGVLADCWSFAKVERHRKRFSRAGEGSPWDTDWDPMAKKTLLVQVAKFAPLSIEAHQAIDLDERAERGVDQALEHAIDVTPPRPDEPADDKPATDPEQTALPSGS